MKTWSSSKKLMTQFLVNYPYYLGSVPLTMTCLNPLHLPQLEDNNTSKQPV